mmetsp:Transcript_27569/g.52474  ORF Transcript_27569/g.52474 Transcript_27569/m.52474 type:complete len:102 (-) Transcript_27569:1631-1936(-)
MKFLGQTSVSFLALDTQSPRQPSCTYHQSSREVEHCQGQLLTGNFEMMHAQAFELLSSPRSPESCHSGAALFCEGVQILVGLDKCKIPNPLFFLPFVLVSQ